MGRQECKLLWQDEMTEGKTRRLSAMQGSE